MTNLGNAAKDLTGKRFGHLTIIGPSCARKQGQIVWRYRCDCGNEGVRVGGNLKRRSVQSCGCRTPQRIRETHVTHGQTNTRLYCVWSNMLSRCNTPSSSVFKHYGGRGIRVCPRWQGNTGFVNFIADMGPLPAGYTLERIDPDGAYTPGNCKWIPAKRQPRNTRRTMRAPDGTPVIDLCEQHGIPYTTVVQRIRRLGWDLDRALTTPKVHNGVIPMPERPTSRSRKRRSPCESS